MNIDYVFRRCTKCGKWLVASSKNFNKNKTGKYGLNSWCKKCRAEHRKANKESIAEYNRQHYQENKEQHRQYREANKEHRAEYNRQYRQENKEALVEYGRQYRQENKEAIAKYRKQYYQENKEAEAEHNKVYSKKYYQENKEAIIKHNRQYQQTPKGQVVAFNSRNRRRAKEQAQGQGITKEQWLEMMSFFNWECAYSGKYLGGNTKDRTIDHIEPISKGGEHEIWNMIPMDRSLNSSKNDKEMLDWYIKQPFCTAERLLKIYNWQEYAKKKYANLIVNN